MHNIVARWLRSKRIFHFQSDQITVVAERDLRLKRELSTELRKELCARPRFPNDKCPRSPDIHDIVGAQISGEPAWAKPPVTADVDPPEENNQSHTTVGQFFWTANR